MNKKSYAKWPCRLILLSLVLGSLLISSPQEKARADIAYTCPEYHNFCLYNCAVAHEGDPEAYTQCAANCEMMQNSCNACRLPGFPYDDCEGIFEWPEPWPVWTDFTMCMDGCQVCNTLPLAERSACFVPCKAHCLTLPGIN